MIRSMTGFGAADAEDENFRVTVEIRAVNQRFLDLTFRMPRGFFHYEEEMTRRIKEKLTRGKVEISINFQDFRENAAALRVDMPLVKAYYNALNEISNALNLPKTESATQIAAYPGVLIADEASLDGVENILYKALSDALESLDSMRLREGGRIEKDFLIRVDELQKMVNSAQELEKIVVDAHRERLKSTVKEMLGDIPYDEGRLLQEVAIYADKVNYTEEIVRLKSHIHQFKNLLETNEPCGRKLDFLIQEMNREANTIGSKGNNKEVSRLVVDMKAEIEKFREQAQNIE
ncbi:MAG: YicC family protein [Selenomonadaceae bacterium]|nr:YicC family protein [Selenomonadaceae bacterium]